ncbi:MAG TPA: glycosyltransferase family 39 protein, partial [Polyangiaceae bacterium]|nr:glycosyltransferase family 39 protein [Polyangiaceae bacterium]
MNESRASWTTTLVVGVISLLPRLYAALAFSREPVWDGHYYDYGARRIAQGLGYSDDLMMGAATLWRPWCHYPVGYSGFLAFLYSIFGNGQFIAPVANALLGAWAVMITHRIGIHWLSPRRAIVAALLCGTSLELILYSPVVMTEVLAMTLPMTAIWIAVVWGKRLSAAVATGAVLGFGTLVQPQTILLAPLLGAVMGGWSLGIRKILWMSFLTTAVALCVVSPWTIRNCRVMDGCAWVSTNGGWNLAIGAFPRATGRFETPKASDGCAV